MFENIFQVEAELGEFARFLPQFFIFQVTMNLIRYFSSCVYIYNIYKYNICICLYYIMLSRCCEYGRKDQRAT